MRTLLVPLQLDSAGHWAVARDPAVILSQQIIDILVTSWGERIMLPRHGANMREFLFSPIIQATLTAKAEEVRSILAAKISFGEILRVLIEPAPGAVSTVRVNVTYRVIETGQPLTVTHTFSGLVDEESVL